MPIHSCSYCTDFNFFAVISLIFSTSIYGRNLTPWCQLLAFRKPILTLSIKYQHLCQNICIWCGQNFNRFLNKTFKTAEFNGAYQLNAFITKRNLKSYGRYLEIFLFTDHQRGCTEVYK